MSARLWVDRTALAANYGRFHEAGATAAVVKADGYGCGAAEVAATLANAGCEAFFVATAEEGVALRERLPDCTIYVFEGPLPDTAAQLAAARLTPVLNTPEQRRLWIPHRGHPVAVHVDTGITRLGFEAPVRAADFAQFDVALVMSHFACADTPDHPLNARQQAAFDRVRQSFPGVPASLCNSAGMAAGLGRAGDLARVGIALYGGEPLGAQTIGLVPVVALEAEVLQVRSLRAGQTVGYGAEYVASGPEQVAVVSLGYADGLFWRLFRAGSAVVGGQRRPLRGRISMDLTCVDATDLAVRPGDSVWFLDTVQTVNAVAKLSGTIAYEVLTAVGARVRRRYVNALPAGARASGER